MWILGGLPLFQSKLVKRSFKISVYGDEEETLKYLSECSDVNPQRSTFETLLIMTKSIMRSHPGLAIS